MMQLSVMHIYHSYVHFAPRTPFWNTYILQECGNEARVLQGHEHQWQPLMRTINLPGNGYTVAYSNNGGVLAVGEENFSQLFHSATGERRAELEADRGSVESVSFSCNNRTLATASNNNISPTHVSSASICLWDVSTGSFITKLEVDRSRTCHSLAFHPFIDHVLVASIGGRVWVWDVSNLTRLTSFQVKASAGYLCWLRTSGIQQHVLVGSWNGNVEIWDVESSQRVRVFTPPLSKKPGCVSAVASSSDGSLIASGSKDGRVVVYNADLGHIVHCFQLDTGVISVAFSPTERTLACGLESISVPIYHLDDGLMVSLKGHRGWVTSVAFSPDGQFLASASWDKTVNVWETSATNFVALNEHHSKNINVIQFLNNGNFLFTRSDMKVFMGQKDLNKDFEQAAMCNSRDLTRSHENS
jgi:WD40 repeat protein